MSENQERIEQFRKMANDDPGNELGHYRLGQLLQEDGQHEEAIASFRRTLELSPQFSKVFQLLSSSLIQLDQRDEAIATLRQGFEVADERGDRIPRDEMARMLVELGVEAPQSKHVDSADSAGDGSFKCQRPTCFFGARARQLPSPPMPDEIGQKIHDSVCADCWNDWFGNYSIKVINELHLDLSTERGQGEYDKHMREFLGLEEA